MPDTKNEKDMQHCFICYYVNTIRRWDSERELFTTTSYMQRLAPTPI